MALFAHSSTSNAVSSFETGLELARDIRKTFAAEPLSGIVLYSTVNHDQQALLRGIREIAGPSVRVFGCSTQGVMSIGNVVEEGYVAGAMGPGQDGAASIDGFFLQASGLVEGGVDMLLAETITSTRTAQSVMAAIEKLFMKIGRELPVLLSVTIGRRGGLISGESMEAFWDTVCSCGLFAVGINCGFGAKHSRPFLEQLSKMANTRISFHPSAGLPNATGGYDETPEEFAAIMGELAKRGQVNIIGGCCGSTPAHTRAIAAAVRGIPRVTIDPL